MGVSEKRFLNAAGFIGYAKDIYEIVLNIDLKEEDDEETDQTLFTRIFLTTILRVILILMKKKGFTIISILSFILNTVKVQN